MNSPIFLITRTSNLFSKERIKYELAEIARKLAGRVRGPQGVVDSLTKGLASLGIPYTLNPSFKNVSSIVHVLSGHEGLKEMINLKRAGKIDTLIAGPNISVLPSDFDKLICNDAIDAILVPSKWVAEMYSRTAPEIAHKIHIWPAGVAIPAKDHLIPIRQRNEIQVFRKDAPEELFQTVISELTRRQLPYRVISYGNISKQKYLKLLGDTKALIYLQRVESQGLLLQEAWSYDIPTLVWNNGEFTYPNTDITVKGAISAPYLTDQAGLFFADSEDFPRMLESFLNKTNTGFFSPREYCQNELSNEVSAMIYKRIVDAVRMV